MENVVAPRKLIEVALPLDAINSASVHESYIYRGNPSALHKWWAQRPLAAARAVVFAQLVNDPASLWECQNPGRSPSLQQRGGFTQRRKFLFQLMKDLVRWENIDNQDVLRRARREIRESWREVCALNKAHPDAATLFDPERLPLLRDPFAGGGTIPMEAQRLGLEVHATDLNPVAIVLNKAMLEIPASFRDMPPVSESARQQTHWRGTAGLSEDIVEFGRWIHKEASRRLAGSYPNVKVGVVHVGETPNLRAKVGSELPVIAWLWARTVRSPNPAFSDTQVPLVSTFVLSTKADRNVWLEPVVDGCRYWFRVRYGSPPAAAKNGTKVASRGANFRCLVSGVGIDAEWIREEARAGRMGQRLLAVVADDNGTRVYLPADEDMETRAAACAPSWAPEVEFFQQALGFRIGNYGMTRWGDIYTKRQLLALSTIVSLIIEVGSHVRRDAVRVYAPGGANLEDRGSGAHAYAEAVSVYLAFALSKVLDYNCSLVPWYTKEDRPGHLFSKQAIPMVWDFVEINPLCEIGGAWMPSVEIVAGALAGLPADAPHATVSQVDAARLEISGLPFFVSTDPPYYDNIGYADLSDFFYVWLRRSLRTVFPNLFTSMAVPKAEELVATPGRHGSKERAEAFFLTGMTEMMRRLAQSAHPSAPLTIYYAFKQSESSDSGTASTGWETFLDAVLTAGLAITGTWPMRTERATRARGIASNALASSVVLVCRRRNSSAPSVTRREFIRELNAVLPMALDEMTRGAGEERSPVAPVDLSQAIIGPGMAVFSKYSAVLEADGTPMSVKTALQLINRFLAEDDFDGDTQFCLHWFDQHGWSDGDYGDADVLARAKATSVGGLQHAGVVQSGAGEVRLVRPADYPADWDPTKDKRLPVWEALHQLVRAFKKDGESGAGKALEGVKAKTEPIRQLAYRLYTLCERRGWADDARAYNELITSWAAIETVANSVPDKKGQLGLFGENP